MSTVLVCDQCGRQITKALVAFHLLTIEEEPRDDHLCSAACLAKFVADEYGARPITSEQFDEARDRLAVARDERVAESWDEASDLHHEVAGAPDDIPVDIAGLIGRKHNRRPPVISFASRAGDTMRQLGKNK